MTRKVFLSLPLPSFFFHFWWYQSGSFLRKVEKRVASLIANVSNVWWETCLDDIQMLCRANSVPKSCLTTATDPSKKHQSTFVLLFKLGREVVGYCQLLTSVVIWRPSVEKFIVLVPTVTSRKKMKIKKVAQCGWRGSITHRLCFDLSTELEGKILTINGLREATILFYLFSLFNFFHFFFLCWIFDLFIDLGRWHTICRVSPDRGITCLVTIYIGSDNRRK